MNLWEAAQRALLCLVLLVLCLLGVQTCLSLRTATEVAAAFPAGVQSAIREQGDLTRLAALGAIADVRTEALAEIARVRVDLFARVDRLTDISARSLADLTERTDRQLTELNRHVGSSLDEVAATAAAARPGLEQSAALLDDARRSWDDLYPDVKASVASGTVAARSVAEASTAISRAAPATAESVQAVTVSAASIAQSWQKQTPLWLRAVGWLGRGFISVKALID